MRVLFVSVEVEPFAKVGGLADVAGSLPKALRAEGHDVRVVMPLYRMIEEDPRWNIAHTLPEFPVAINPNWVKTASFSETEIDGLPVGFIGTDEWYTESDRSERVYQPGGDMHLFLCRAVMQAMERLDWIPDVVHVHDWHTGFLPVLIREQGGEKWADVATVFTIHNLAYQGEFGPEVLDALGLSHDLYRYDRLETWGRVNFLKSGCVYADQVNTVSPNYAREIQTPEFGCTLEGLMAHLSNEGRLHGILNGIDVERHDPETDRHLPVHFSAENPEGKRAVTSALRAEIGLPEMAGAPLFGVVSRLSSQKGIDMILDQAERLFAAPAQLVVLGVGDPSLAEWLRDLEAKYPDHVRLIERFDAPLAQRIYAGCDGFLMPSMFEPCGLGQMFAMRYGTVPVVRTTGGLADTVFEGENGFTFAEKDASIMMDAIDRAIAAYRQPEVWSRLVANAMAGDYSWTRSARQYVDLYRAARAVQQGQTLTKA